MVLGKFDSSPYYKLLKQNSINNKNFRTMETKEFNVGDVVTFGDNNVGIVRKVSLTGVYTVIYFDSIGLTSSTLMDTSRRVRTRIGRISRMQC